MSNKHTAFCTHLSRTCSLFEEFSSWVCRCLCRRVVQILHRVWVQTHMLYTHTHTQFTEQETNCVYAQCYRNTNITSNSDLEATSGCNFRTVFDGQRTVKCLRRAPLYPATYLAETVSCLEHIILGLSVVHSYTSIHTHNLPLSGRMSLQGRARGVMECWQTRAVRLPDSETEKSFRLNILQTAPLCRGLIHCG